jgi:hypothetical protein
MSRTAPQNPMASRSGGRPPAATKPPPAKARASHSKNMSRELDDYIAKVPPYAQPILKRLRALFHQACPEVDEALKWSHPAFVRGGMICVMAAFKEHVRVSFWKGTLLHDPKGLFRGGGGGGTVGVLQVSDVSELPPDEALLDFIRQAVELNVKGVKAPRAVRQGKATPLAIPDELAAALRKNKRAHAGFESMSTSQRNEYVDWLVTAKQDATRQKRLLTAIEWLSESKPRHWKYMKAS